MKTGIFLLWISIVALMSAAAFLGIFFYFDPFIASPLIIVLFHLTLLFALTGIFTLAGYFLRRVLRRKKMPIQDALASFWQGSLLALIIVGSLLMAI